MDLKALKEISIQSTSKILFLIIDGLGGLAQPGSDQTELETAHTPNLDDLAKRGICGLVDPVARGITPGSGPGHLAIFGYDPIKYNLGRGVLEAAGVEFELTDRDVAARGNFATIDDEGNVKDRRAGRIRTQKNAELCGLLDGQALGDIRVFVKPIKEHRFLAVFHGPGLSPEVTDTDPQQIGIAPKDAQPRNEDADKTAEVVNHFIANAKDKLSTVYPANMVLLRGFSKKPDLPSMNEIYKLNAAAVAAYPMYKGISRLTGMDVLKMQGQELDEQFRRVREAYKKYDFVFLHVKKTDSAGEDGDFDKKVQILEQIDQLMPTLTELDPDVLVVTGDHSTPAVLKSHSWHPVPFMLVSKWCRPDMVSSFAESSCLSGGLGRMNALDIMPLAMANALKLKKFGA